MNSANKVVVVHRGARDGFQVARGLNEAGRLEALVTDAYWPADDRWAAFAEDVIPRAWKRALRARYAETLPSQSVSLCKASGASSMFAEKLRLVPFGLRRRLTRWCDDSLGHRAGRLATERGAALLSYSYYAHSAFSQYAGAASRILFQLHPHPARVRAILRAERDRHPECAASLDKEWELALPEDDFRRLEEESAMAEHCIVASSFTKQTLAGTGMPAERICVIPYGIDLARFHPAAGKDSSGQPLRVLFVGSISQRKGIKYLLDAIKLLPAGRVELTVCGRPVDNLELFRNITSAVRVFPAIGAQGLLAAYRQADVFVFPSLAEGFGQVLLEAMASGLPIISTTRTAAPDLISNGREGWVIPPGDTNAIAEAVEYFLKRPSEILQMGRAARERAEFFTWARFRRQVAAVVGSMVEASQPEGLAACV